MKRHFRFFASASVGTVSLLIVALTAFTALSQQRATPALPGAPAPAGQAAPVAGGARAQALPGTENGWSTFQLRCASCHLNPAVDLATPGTVLRQMTPEKIYESLTTAR
jgi:cytochrome c5